MSKKIEHLGIKTDLMLNAFSGLVEEKDNYTVIKTMSNPESYWGNYLIFNQAPQKGDYQRWCTIFDQEFFYYSQKHHYAFTWLDQNIMKPNTEEFESHGFNLETNQVMRLDQFNHDTKFNDVIEIKSLKSDQEWNDTLELQILCSVRAHATQSDRTFKTEQFKQYRTMSQQNRGHWYGAYIGNKLIADLGIFHNNKIGRYQAVETHPDFRNQNICKAMIKACGEMAIEEHKLKSLIIVADEHDYAKNIYTSVGFKCVEYYQSLTWWQGK
ncbi:GNAT family N-acetyltransferase [bacterium]|nr:GNAT family N-acetyltransferase [bacterium]